MTLTIDHRCRFAAHPNPAREHGLTLIELLIAMALGIFLLAVTMQMFVNSKQTYLTLDGSSQLQTSGQFGLSFVERSLQLAGYKTALGRGSTLTAFPAAGTFAAEQVVSGIEGGGLPDTVRIRFQGASDGLVRDCVGNVVTTNATVSFWVNNNKELICTDSKNQQHILVEGVDDFQVLYGIDTSDKEVVGRYLTASAMNATHWQNVVAIRVGLIINSMGSVQSADTETKITRMDGITKTFNDKLLHKEFVSTVVLRNRTP